MMGGVEKRSQTVVVDVDDEAGGSSSGDGNQLTLWRLLDEWEWLMSPVASPPETVSLDIM